MKPKIFSRDTIDIAAVKDALENDQLIVIPTDTVYGIAARPTSSTAIDKLLAAKGRGRDYPSPVLVSDSDQARGLCANCDKRAQVLMDKLWPGALTVVVPANERVGWDLGETQGTIALRMPDDDEVRDLLSHTGPLAVTSANLHGQPPADTIDQAQQYFGDRVAIYIDGGASKRPIPSTIVKVVGDEPVEFIRHGAIDPDIVRELVQEA